MSGTQRVVEPESLESMDRKAFAFNSVSFFAG